MIFDGLITKPSVDDALEHYGVKGMKWKNRKHVHKVPAGQENNPVYQYLNNMTEGKYQARLKKVKLTKGSGGKSSSSSKSGKGSGLAKEKTSSSKSLKEAKTADDKLSSLKNTDTSVAKRVISEDYTKYLEGVLSKKQNASRLSQFKEPKNKR